MTDSTQHQAPSPRRDFVVGTAIGGGLFGCAEVLSSVAASSVSVSLSWKLLLSIGGALLFSVAVTVLLFVVLRGAVRSWLVRLDPAPQWVGFWLGIGFGVPVLCVLRMALGESVAWEHWLVAGIAPWLGFAMAVAVPVGRGRVFSAMLGLAPLIVWVEFGRRDVQSSGFAAADAPHVVLVTVEGLRGLDWPEPLPRTPNIDALAASGVRFLRAVVPEPSVGGAVSSIAGHDEGTGLAAGFLRAGWRTAAFTGRRNVFRRAEDGFERVMVVHPVRALLSRSVVGSVLGRLGPTRSGRRSDRSVVNDALSWLEDGLDEQYRPAFAWVHLTGPVAPVRPAPPWDTAYADGDPWDPAFAPLREQFADQPSMREMVGDRTNPRWLRGQHAGAVSAVDSEIGRIHAFLAEHATDRPLVFAVVGTHGELLGEEGLWLTPTGAPREVEVIVTLVLTASGKLPHGGATDEVVSLADLRSTLFELSGIVDGSTEQSSLVPVAFGRRGRGWAASVRETGSAATLIGRWWSISYPGDDLTVRAGGDASVSEKDVDMLRSLVQSVAVGGDRPEADAALRMIASPPP